MFPSLRTFFISILTFCIGIILLGVYLYFSCLANPGCSGEYGIVFGLLGYPWSLSPQFLSLGFPLGAGIAILLNIVILSFIIQVLVWCYRFFFPSDTSRSKGSA